MEYVFCSVCGYLIGSVPTAYLVIKKIKGIDITRTGSGNAGAMNSYEVTNSKLTGIIVMLIDALKGLLSVYLMILLLPVNFVYPALALLFAVFSHCFNPWLNFKGGRGLATAAGGALLIFPVLLVTWLSVWLIIFLIKKDILFANIWAVIMSVVIIFSSNEIAYRYAYPAPDTISTMILFTASLMLIIFIRHIEPLKEIISQKKFFVLKRK